MSVSILPDGRVVSGSRKVADWKFDSNRKLLVTFVDDRFGKVAFSPRSSLKLSGLTKGPNSWSCHLNRVQRLAVVKTDTQGKLISGSFH